MKKSRVIKKNAYAAMGAVPLKNVNEIIFIQPNIKAAIPIE
jgi:hypothetical protein